MLRPVYTGDFCRAEVATSKSHACRSHVRLNRCRRDGRVDRLHYVTRSNQAGFRLSLNRDIPSGGALELSIPTKACAGTVAEINKLEHVVLTISFIHRRRGDVSILMMSPSGTKNEMLSTRHYDDSKEGLDNWGFMTVHCWGKCCSTCKISSVVSYKFYSISLKMTACRNRCLQENKQTKQKQIISGANGVLFSKSPLISFLEKNYSAYSVNHKILKCMLRE